MKKAFEQRKCVFLAVLWSAIIAYWAFVIIPSVPEVLQSAGVTSAQALPVGSDTREEVLAADRNRNPYESIVQIGLFNDKERFGKCTAFAISSRTIMTAAHCLDKGVTQVELYGRVSTDFEVSRSEDFGVVRFDKEFPVDSLSLGGFPSSPADFALETAGFPSDKESGTMWRATYQGFVNYGSDRLGYESGGEYNGRYIVSAGGVSYGGQSGSPLFDGNTAVGILVGSQCEECEEEATHFISFTPEVLEEIYELAV